MSTDAQIAFYILQAFDIAILRRTGPGQYVFFGHEPEFYARIFPGTGEGPCVCPWVHSPMLDFFEQEAESFFEQGLEGSISSGVWQEDGKTDEQTALIAVATISHGVQIIIIRMLHDDYKERTGILRKAREQLLENQHLTHHLELFREKSRIDGLTRIFNRETFFEILQDEIGKVQTTKAPLSLIILDIDNFKKINDTYGHLAGDSVLRSLGNLLNETLRYDDIVARYGGEEFVVLVPRTSEEQVLRIGEKLRKTIEEIAFGELPTITVSIGCTMYVPGESIQGFIDRADKALYDAKNQGKNLVRMR
ncbi:GGDEF domain-containing protein [Desulfovibrio sp. OttesenSCG-928-A18]|nr:GGDEF domain-containing protein [Desulfovibrio sp. OttesenSCG-928-A18]